MLSLEGDVEARALADRGWSISAIARHLGVNRKTVRAYLSGERTPGQRRRSAPAVIAPFVEYCRLRLVDDPHLWASTLFDELVEMGFTGSYPSLTLAIRTMGLRPHCEPCHSVKGRDVAVIAHPAGVETQWDWVGLPDPPASWVAGRQAHLLVGALAHSSRWRGVLAPAEDFAHLVEALEAVSIDVMGVPVGHPAGTERERITIHGAHPPPTSDPPNYVPGAPCAARVGVDRCSKMG